jgi:superfamily II DNA or RNA helicase
MNTLFNLWPHQESAVNEIQKAWSQEIKSICVQGATGSGKSRIIRTIVDWYRKDKKIIYIIAHRKNLVQQLSNEISEIGIKHGIIKSGSPYVRYRIQVASLQTIVRRHNIPEPDIIIIDEFHHCKCKSYMNLIEKWSNAKTLGLTATPARTDGSPLNDVCKKLIIGPPTKKLINDGFLVDYEYYAPDNISMNGVHKRMGEFVQSEVLARVDKRKITGCAIEHYKKYADRMPAIASCVNIIHSEHVAQEFRNAGYKAIAIHSKMDDKEINRSITGLRSGTIEILCQCDLLGEGVDIKGAVALIGLRPTNSLVIFLQHIGRVLRIAPGKEKAIILDHVGNWERFGLPDDEREWSLDGIVKRKKGELDHKRCPDCIRPVPKTTRKCPFCGHLWTETAEQAKQGIPEQQEGQLINVKDHQQNQKLRIMIARGASTLKEAIAIAKNHGVTHRHAWYIWTHVLKKGA